MHRHHIALCLLALSTTASAGPTLLDQSFGPIADPRYLVLAQQNLPNAQTFTNSLDGLLDHVDLRIYRDPAVTAPVVVGIYPTTPAGQPVWGATPWATVTLPAADVPTFSPPAPYVSFDFSSAKLHVTPGLKLAAVVTTTEPYPFLGAPAYIWASTSQGAGLYSRGDAWYRNSLSGIMETGIPFDYDFQTFVTLPEPVTAMPVLPLLATLARRRQRA